MNNTDQDDVLPNAAPGKQLSPAAKRALMEALERQKAQQPRIVAKEIAGRDGPDPVRYGDWEVGGIASDF